MKSANGCGLDDHPHQHDHGRKHHPGDVRTGEVHVLQPDWLRRDHAGDEGDTSTDHRKSVDDQQREKDSIDTWRPCAPFPEGASASWRWHFSLKGPGPIHGWRATITGVAAACTTAELTEPRSIPANPPRP